MNQTFLLKLDAFGKVLHKLEELTKKEKLSEVERDACMQRFEFCFELCWKSLKAYAKEEGLLENNSPKATLKNAFQLKIIKEEELWLKMLETRNLLSHTYNEAFAEESLKTIQNQFAPALRKLWELLHAQL